jgi:hypothetical protein
MQKKGVFPHAPSRLPCTRLRRRSAARRACRALAPPGRATRSWRYTCSGQYVLETAETSGLSGSARKSQNGVKTRRVQVSGRFRFGLSRFNVQTGAQNGATIQFESQRHCIYILRSRYVRVADWPAASPGMLSAVKKPLKRRSKEITKQLPVGLPAPFIKSTFKFSAQNGATIQFESRAYIYLCRDSPEQVPSQGAMAVAGSVSSTSIASRLSGVTCCKL